MSILWFLVSLIACGASAAGAAWGMRWWIERNRIIAEREDPRDTQIRELQAAVKVAREDVRRAQASAEVARSQAEKATNRETELVAAISLAQQQQEQTAQMLKDEIAEKTGWRDELARLRREADALQTRKQELELELRMTHNDGNLLDPALQLGQVEA